MRGFFKKAFVAILVGLAFPASHVFAFSPGDLLRTTKKETLHFLGEPFLAAPKGQEFILLEHAPAQKTVSLAFIQKEGGLIAVTLPDSSVEAVPLEGWGSLLRGVQLFHDLRFEDAKKLLVQGASDAAVRPLANRLIASTDALFQAAVPVHQILAQSRSGAGASPEAIRPRLEPAQTAFVGAMRKMHELVAELDKQGQTSLAFFLDEGSQRLALRLIPQGFPANGAEIPQPPYSRPDLAARASKSAFSAVRCRQAVAVRRMVEAAQYVEEGLKVEPARPDLLKMQGKIQEDIRDAEGRADAAEENRKRNLGQALLALERGLKYCADHPRLVKLREDMSGVLEQKTSPKVTPEFMAAAGASSNAKALEEGHRLYTTRCSQCHELEMLDSRSLSGWKNEVAGMAGRAKINAAQQSSILEYIAAALVAIKKP
jgi:hypothetical protein